MQAMDGRQDVREGLHDEVTLVLLENITIGLRTCHAFLGTHAEELHESLIQAKSDGGGTLRLTLHLQMALAHRVLQGLHDQRLRIAYRSVKIKYNVFHIHQFI